MKNKITLLDKVTNKSLVLASEDTFNSNLVLMLPNKDGTLALVEDLEEIKTFLQDGILLASDSSKLGGKDASFYVLTDMSNIDLDALSPATLNGLKGYIGSKGDTGNGFTISAIFNSLAELLAGTTTEETFAMVGGTLPLTNPDYGKLYLRKNNTWNYITDLSVEGAAGITGPQGLIGYTGSRGLTGSTGTNGTNGTNGNTGYTGSQGNIGYTGSQGVTGIGYTGSKGDTGATGPQGPQGATGATGAQGASAAIDLGINAVGTYVLGVTSAEVNTGLVYGGYVAGSSLSPSSCNGEFQYNTTLPGTWRCHGFITNGSLQNSQNTTLFFRVA